ncbi:MULTISPECIES: hypothetical protein [Bacillus amyloliquefaciens group]|uniref:hypothetical protein n=1 Tax=Bacillus amyloliquefaciens group TaxID=1938374 RepID=UPI0007EBB267|nr:MULTISPECIES: hypothetical protein [Bacillus amyloliquefaciens group]ATC53282.1 hypothetical protein CLI97_04059 [Bacillus velezensis]OAZ62908.1 hypothetical protein SRCM100169_02131 [Bacillus siamensis]WNJ75564.1 hypothetical protein RNI18_00950 [Bacillus velezensis]
MSNSLERKINIHFSSGSHIESKQLSNKLRGYNSNFLWEQMQESITKELKWWGVTLTGNQKTVKALSELMTINKTLFENLYKVQSDTIEELVNKLYEQVPEYEKKFLKFVNEQIPNLRMCLQFELPYNPQLISSIEYEIYISGAEIDCEYPHDARDCIITFFQRIPEIIGSYKEELDEEYRV